MEDFGIRMLLSECTVANLIHVLCPVVRLSFFRSFALRNKLQRPHLVIGLQEINPLLLGFTKTCASRMAHRLRQTKSLASLPKNRALPRSSNTSSNNNSSSSSRPSSRPLQSLSKTSPGWALTGCNFNEVRTRCKRGPNEVQASKRDRGETEGRQRDASLANKYTIATTFIFGSIVGKPKKI